MLELDVKPFLENGRTLVPLRGVMEKLGAVVEWFAEQKTVKVQKDGISIELVVGETTAKVVKNEDGVPKEEIIELDVPSKIVDDRTFIPVRLVAEALGADVGWDEKNMTVKIRTTDFDGIAQEDIGESLESMGKAISVDSIKEMKLYSLMQEEIKTLSREEIEKIINSLNTSPTFNGAYIEMLAGNNIKIELNNGGSILLTSFGSRDYVVMSVEINGEYATYCIMSPEVGSILLDQEYNADEESENTEPQAFYNSFTGTVKEISGEKEDIKTVFVEDKEGKQAYFKLSKDTFYLDDVKIEVGKEITGYYEAGRPMIMIYPPHYSIDIVTGVIEGQNIKADKFDSDLLSADKTLKLNLSEETKIEWSGSTKASLPAKPTIEQLADLIANKKLIVFYGATTKSIPAQTTPSRIIVLE